MRSPADPSATRGTSASGWSALQGHFVSLLLVAGMGFLGWDVVQYLLNGSWDWTVASDIIGQPETGWPGVDNLLRVLLSLHMSIFCVVAAWAIGKARQAGAN